jgi:hypothetical protein
MEINLLIFEKTVKMSKPCMCNDLIWQKQQQANNKGLAKFQ